MIYLMDSNAVADVMFQRPEVLYRIQLAKTDQHEVAICHPIYYEIMRGLLKRSATIQIDRFKKDILPLFAWQPLIENDWNQAAIFWSDMVRKGRQISDIDLLLAAMTYRLNAIVVTNDNDFDSLPIRRENWHP